MNYEQHARVKELESLQSAETAFRKAFRKQKKSSCKSLHKKYDAKEDIYECPVCIVEARSIWFRLLEDIKKRDVMHFAYTLETSDRKLRDTSYQNISRDQKMFIAAAEETQGQSLPGTWRCLLRYAEP